MPWSGRAERTRWTNRRSRQRRRALRRNCTEAIARGSLFRELLIVLSKLIVGTWEVLSRIDRTEDGVEVEEPSLGTDPVALIYYDSGGRFAAQFMRRSGVEVGDATALGCAAPNNSRAMNGYDAYFGTYNVDDEQGLVTQTLMGALSRENVGMVLTRKVVVAGDRLVIEVPTAMPGGTPVHRTLTCKRVC